MQSPLRVLAAQPEMLNTGQWMLKETWDAWAGSDLEMVFSLSSCGTWRVSSGRCGLQVLHRSQVLVDQVLWEAGGEISRPA